ncbi:YdbL family protein [Magnetofaba australis]|uniref:DUF1318 domain-containing protein n=1 Tax=Magnetofaba australis IT-1 TaxID=1434232 RepID=A0A1Y2K5Q3_9PROT|nr:YdbL family protein [Magnetofaba australis]OSM05014.1 hypothetical protein MAIT1_03143 [Magnetofaba australis IT-1]
MRKTLHMLLLGATLFVAACVTVNIYFPAPAMQEAAERIVQEVWGDDPAGGKSPEQGAKPDAKPGSGALLLRNMVVTAANWMIPSANAQSADINVSTAAIRAVKDRIHARADQLRPYLDRGVVGILANGDLVLRDPGSISLRERSIVERLVALENQDRAALYREIAQANGHPDWQGSIRDVFAQKWRGQARGGWWVQQDGMWLRK